MTTLDDYSKEKLVKRVRSHARNIGRQKSALKGREDLLMIYRTKLFSLRDQIDYLLEHPYSREFGNRKMDKKKVMKDD